MANFQEVIKRLRESRGLTQAALADILELKQQTISKWEKGGAVPAYDVLEKLAVFFNVTPNVLFGVDPIPETDETEAGLPLSSEPAGDAAEDSRNYRLRYYRLKENPRPYAARSGRTPQAPQPNPGQLFDARLAEAEEDDPPVKPSGH